MLPRQLFTGIFTLSLALAACSSNPSSASTSIPSATELPSPVAQTATTQPSAVPSADAGGNNPTAAPPTTQSPAVSPTAAAPAQIPDPKAYTWTQIASSLANPTDIKNAGDG